MKINKIKLLAVCFMLAITSCEKGFLDKGPDEDLSFDDVFAERNYAERFLAGTYEFLPQEIDFAETRGRNPFVAASDDMEMTWLNRFAHVMNSGSWNPVNVQNEQWNQNFQAIRRLHIFTENIHKTPMSEADRNIWIGEAEFLKAFFYFWMIRIYGPVPIVDQSFQPTTDFSGMKRQPLEDCIAYVVEKCDKAAALLPLTVPTERLGRATKAAALALKARVLLYMASPLWNGNSDLADFRDQEGVRLFPEYDDGRWQRAADAARRCIAELEGAGYKLYRSADNDPMKNYQDLFVVRNNSEIIFARNMHTDQHQERCAAPNGMGGWSGYCPLQRLVDAYQMADGSTPITGYTENGQPIINPESGYIETGYTSLAHPKEYYPEGVRNMYVGREPRFYATINFSGAMWRGRQLEFWNTGKDGRSKGGAELFTITGYLLKKFMDEENVNIPQGKFTLKTWNYFRLGEQYLNYAEALNEAQGPVDDVYTYVNAIRDRAGLPELPQGLSKEEMRERIRHERRIELAFETHRYFDTRRWKIAGETNNIDLYGMNITAGTHLQDDAFYKRVYIKGRVFDEKKHYHWPIAQEELNISPLLTQNPGW